MLRRPSLRSLSLFLLALLATSCNRQSQPSQEVAKIVTEFVYENLAFSPIGATGVGYHQHRGQLLDEQLDDWSPESLAKQRQFYQRMQKQVGADSQGNLPTAQRVDLEILKDQSGAALLELDTIQSYKHNPTLYVEALGNALFNPYVLNYAPLAKRWEHIVARMEKIPAFLETAKRNLTDSPEIWNKVAREENDGTIALIDQKLRLEVPAPLKPRFESAAAKSLTALRGFNDWLANDLSKRTSDWRLGKANYAQKYKYALAITQSPEELLSEAEKALETTRLSMKELAKPLHEKYYPGAPVPTELNTLLKATLAKITEQHATAATYLGDARKDLDDITRFVREQNLVTLPRRGNLQVIETPEFMRGIYGVGGFSPAPALEPELGAFYWVTPIPENWPPERIESKLREYNFHGLKLLTIHEAVPGHWVQMEYANDVQPTERRLLRALYGSGAYVEGWAVYATEAVLDAGYLDKSPELRLIFLKQQLRMIANTILDVRMQTMQMTDEEAMKLMIELGFQEREEATAKLQRAKLSSTQLPTYYAGYREWVKLRDAEKGRLHNEYRPIDFHEKALQFGPVPLRLMPQLMKEAAK